MHVFAYHSSDHNKSKSVRGEKSKISRSCSCVWIGYRNRSNYIRSNGIRLRTGGNVEQSQAVHGGAGIHFLSNPIVEIRDRVDFYSECAFIHLLGVLLICFLWDLDHGVFHVCMGLRPSSRGNGKGTCRGTAKNFLKSEI